MNIKFNKRNNKYEITELTDHEMRTMAEAFSTISSLFDYVYYDLDSHKQRAMEVKKMYAELSHRFFKTFSEDFIIEGRGIESYILPSIAIEFKALKMGIRTYPKDDVKQKS